MAGLARGRRLQVPAEGTRPTSERAREALFNTLRSELDLVGASVLDLYAGSGAIGLEALSRGAGPVVLVESNPQASAAIAANISAVGLPGARLHRADVATFLAGQVPTVPFDLIFADPPYALEAVILGAVLHAACQRPWLAVGGIVVLERTAREPEPPWPDLITPLQSRRYGAAMLWYGRRN